MTPSESFDLLPAQLASFYATVGGDYDPLFVGTPPASIAFIYKSLGCRHSLQPATTDDDFATPSVPALKPKGFVTWQTIQILLCPEEHMPFIQNAVSRFDIKDPETGQLFPKLLPAECFPSKPDEQMVAWYEAVSERLMKEAQMEQERQDAKDGKRFSQATGSRDYLNVPNEAIDAHNHRPPKYDRNELRTSKDKLYKPWQPFDFVEEKGRYVASTVKNFWDHHPRSHLGSYSGHATKGSSSYVRNATSNSPRGRSRPSHSRRRSSSLTSLSSEEAEPRSRHGHYQDPRAQRRQSYEPSSSPRYDSSLQPPDPLKPFSSRTSGSSNSSPGPFDDPRLNRRSIPKQLPRDVTQERRGRMPDLSTDGRPSVVSYSRADFESQHKGRERRFSPSHPGDMPQPAHQRAGLGNTTSSRERPPMQPYSFTSPAMSEAGGMKYTANASRN